MNNNNKQTKSSAKGKQKSQRTTLRGGRPNPTIQPQAVIVKAPVASGSVRTTKKPQMRGQVNGDVVISHREYVNDFNGSVAFTANALAINPGLSSMFPWLSQIAQNYESYVFRELKFCFETESPTSATGTVMMAVDYDASDATPVNKTQLMAYRQAVRSPPWSDSCLINMREDIGKRKSYYVRNGSLGSNQDIKLYDTGNLFLCSQGQAGTDTVGELYVEYVCHLMTPQLGNPGIGDALWATYVGTSNSALANTKAGNLPATVSASGTTTSVTTFTFTQPWRGCLFVALIGTGLTSVTPSGTATASEFNEVVNAAATNLTVGYNCNAQIGQTLILTVVNTTVTASNILFGQGGN